MTEIERLADQMQRAFYREAWCGPSLLETLQGVGAAQAAARPLARAHSIWEIVSHVSGWKRTVHQRLEGQPARLPEEGDWPPIADTSERSWQETLSKLKARHDALLAAVRGLAEARLEDVLLTESSRETGGGVSCYVTLHGAAQHDLYHGGQISLLRKG
ncbi:MAG TPA: DinB family protein [Pyrinomonadaceae bacterium]|nr:DinB family protein [Pyrinomonadaceae bacterium]